MRPWLPLISGFAFRWRPRWTRSPWRPPGPARSTGSRRDRETALKARVGLVLPALAFVSCQSAPQSGPVLPEPGGGRGAYVVYTELGKSQVAMKPGSNVRVFNSVHGDGGTFIRYDPATGILTLAPGTYRINGYSITTFGYLLTKEQQSAVRSVPGYAYLF